MSSHTTKRKAASRLAGLGAGALLAVGLSIGVAAPASASSCSALGSDWNRVIGSCTGYPSFTVNWTCWGVPGSYSKTYYTSPSLPGYSFNFDACGPVGVTGVWVS